MLGHEDIVAVLAMQVKGVHTPETVGGYLERLLTLVWSEGEEFDGKRPFGNSGWHDDLAEPLFEAGLLDGQQTQKRVIKDGVSSTETEMIDYNSDMLHDAVLDLIRSTFASLEE